MSINFTYAAVKMVRFSARKSDKLELGFLRTSRLPVGKAQDGEALRSLGLKGSGVGDGLG